MQVTQVKALPHDCTTALQIGCGSKKGKRLKWHQQAFFQRRELPYKCKLERPCQRHEMQGARTAQAKALQTHISGSIKSSVCYPA
jgi:hypothetical protein